MPKLSDEERERRRAHIIGAAIACFARKGYHETSMRDIFREAGVSAGAVHNYFPAKIDLLKAIIESSKESNAAMYDAAQQGEVTNPVTWLLEHSFAEVFRQSESRKKSAINIDLILEAHRNDEVRPLILDIWQQAFDNMGETVEAGQERGEITDGSDVSTLTNVLWAQYVGMLALRLVKADLDTDAMIDWLLKVVTKSGDATDVTKERG
jgi:AcrR family transcriptional regulator